MIRANTENRQWAMKRALCAVNETDRPNIIVPKRVLGWVGLEK